MIKLLLLLLPLLPRFLMLLWFFSTYDVAAATGAAVVLLPLPSRLYTRSTATGQRYAYWPHYTALLSQCGLAFTTRMEGSMTLYKQATAMAGTQKQSTDQHPPAIQVQGKRSSQRSAST